MLVEKRPWLGGVIRTEVVDGCVVEAGPDSYLTQKPAATELARELGLGSEVIGSNDHLRRTFILRGGRMVAIPDGLQMMVPTRVAPMVSTRLLSWSAKARMGMEWFRNPPTAPLPDRSVSDFVRDHYGQEAVDYLAEPLLAGVYGGDPGSLSVNSVLPRFVELEKKYGSLTKGTLAAMAQRSGPAAPLFQTLKGGLSQLTGTIEKAIEGHARRIRGEAEAVERTDRGYRIRVSGTWMDATDLVLACEAHGAARLTARIDTPLADCLEAVGYSTGMTMSLGFSSADAGRAFEGFGFLIPKKERGLLMACTFVGNKFSHRVPKGMLLLRCFVGGALDEATLRADDETLVAGALEELRRLIGLSAKPRFWRVSRWPRAMAQYAVGHQQRMQEVDARLASLGGLYLAGNAYSGIGVPDCVRMGKQAAARIAAYNGVSND